MTASADFLVVVVKCGLNRFIALPLVAVRTLKFLTRFFFNATPSPYIICLPWLDSLCSCLFEVVVVSGASDMSHASGASFSISSYSSIINPLYTVTLLVMIWNVFRNNIMIEFQIQYTIKNRFWSVPKSFVVCAKVSMAWPGFNKPPLDLSFEFQFGERFCARDGL